MQLGIMVDQERLETTSVQVIDDFLSAPGSPIFELMQPYFHLFLGVAISFLLRYRPVLLRVDLDVQSFLWYN